jgi:hypothetical protein
MGIWQVFGMSSVLGCQIVFVYPNKGNPSVRADLNRLIMTWHQTSDHVCYMMWTSTRDDMVNKHWVPNHFVPLVPLIAPSAKFGQTTDVNGTVETEVQEASQNQTESIQEISFDTDDLCLDEINYQTQCTDENLNLVMPKVHFKMKIPLI